MLMGLLLRKPLTSLLYRKLLKLPVSGIIEISSGKLITLASGDMTLIEEGTQALPYLFAAPLSTIFQLVILFNLVSLLLST